MSSRTTLLSLSDYASLANGDERILTELVRGTVVREPRPGDMHGRVQVALTVILGEWARTHGASCTVESGYILAEDPATVRGPDVAVVLEPRSAIGQPGGWVRGAPDLVVEVLSPSDTSSEVQRKTLDYLEAGARLVWIVDPGARTVLIQRPDRSATLVRDSGTLTGEGVLDELVVELGAVFG